MPPHRCATLAILLLQEIGQATVKNNNLHKKQLNGGAHPIPTHEENTLTAFKLGTATVFALAICSVQALAQAHFQNNLMPQPAEISFGSDALALNSTFAVEVPGA